MIYSKFSNIVLASTIALHAVTSASNFAFTNGDLILGFQASGGTGSTKNVFVNLGSGVSARNGGVGTEKNIGSTLSGVFGANWYTRSDIWFGVLGNLNANPNSGIGNRPAVDGDPSRTWYVSRAASTAGSAALINAGTYVSSSLGTAGTNLSGMEGFLPNLTAQADGSAILDQSANQTEWNNSWTKWNPIVGGAQGASLNVFTGGVQQTFGQSGSETYIDLQRVLSTNTGADPTGVAGGGTYVATVSISSTGAIRLIKASANNPEIAIQGGPIQLNTTAGTPSDATSFTVSGANMTAAINVNAPTGFEVSTSSNASFSSNITVGTSGTIASTPVYVRIPANASSGNYTGNITLSSTGAESKNISVTGTVTAPTPVISVSGTLTALSTTYGTASSTSNFTISGANMTAPITVTPPAGSGFQVSTSSTDNFSGNLTIQPTAGTINNTTIHVRLSPTANAGTYSGNISLTSTGATEKSIATASSTISKATQTIDAIANIGSKTFGDAAFAVTTPSSSSSLPTTLSVKSGPATISGNTVTLTGAGTVVIAANQTGNTNYNAASEVTTSFTVSKGAQTIGAFTSIGTKAFGDAPFAVTAPSSSSSLPVTLSVKSGPATISGNTVTLTGVGSVTLAANQAGNDNYNAATEVTTSFSVSKATQTIETFTSIGNKAFGDAPFAVTAPTASSGLAVTLSVKSGPASISGNTVTITGAGTVVLAANQVGNADYAAATEVTTSFSVLKAAQTIATFTSIGNKTFGHAPFTVTAPSSTSSLPVTLTVKSGPATISGNTVTLTGAGTIVLAANQGGNGNYGAASEVTTSFSVSKATPTLTSSPTASPIKKGQNLSQSNLTGGSTSAAGASVVGSFAFTDPSTAPDAGTTNHSVTFTPTNTANYNTFTFNVSVTVNESSLSTLTSPNTSSGDCFQPFQYQITATNNPTGFAANNLPEGLSINASMGLISGTPTKAGTYDVILTITNTAGDFGSTLKITIDKAAQSIASFADIGNKAFGDAAFAITTPTASSSLPTTLSVKSGPATILGNSVTLTGAGTVVLAANQVGNDNYNAAGEVTTSFSVSKAIQTIGAFTSISNKTFGDVPLAVTAPSSSSSLPITLSVKSGPATISANTVTLTGAGNVVLAANQAGNENYAAATEVTTSFTVNKATPLITTKPSASAITYGQTLAQSNISGGITSVPGTFTFTNPNTAPSAGSANQSVTFTPTHAANYNSVTTDISVTVNKPSPNITSNPVASAITFGQKLSDSSLSGGTSSVPGVFEFTDPNVKPGTGISSQSVTFTPNDTINYSSTTINISVTVNKATPSITNNPTANAITYGQKLSETTLNTGSASVLGTFAFSNPNTVPSAGSASQSVTFSPTDSTNYNTATTNITVTVNKAAPAISSNPTASAITYGQKLSSSTINGGIASVPGTFAFTNPDTSPNTGSTNQSITFTPTDTSNYSTTSANISVTVNKATPSITTKPNPSNITLGQKLADSTLNGGIASVNGSFAFTNPNTQPSTVGTSSHSVTFTPADTNNYLTTTTSVDVVTQAGSSPVITIQPIDLTISQGNSATFSVQATGQNLSYQWKRNGVDISNAKSSSYTVSSTSIATAGEYSVVVSSDNGSQPVTSRAAKLIVTFPLADLNINENTSPVLSVSVTGTGLKYQWFKDGMPLRGQTNSTLTLKDITVDQAGSYSVEVTDADGNKFTSQSSKVTVNAVMPEIISQPSNASAYTGGSATMRVMVKGSGHTYQWRKNGTAIQGETKNTLTITDLISEDAGDYSVLVTNSVGTVTSRSARLRVLTSNTNPNGQATSRPVITSHPISATLNDGGTATLSVKASGGGLLYQWMKNKKNITGANQSTYTIRRASAADIGDYTVAVYNSRGTATSNIAKIAISAPEIDVQQPAGSSLVSSTSKISFGTAKTTSTGIRRTFTIRNTGTVKLTRISFSKSGTHQGDFTITQSNLREVAPGASATFTVTFKPTATGARTASIRIASNDRDENPFIINLAGQGAR